MAGSCRMIDVFAKDTLHGRLRRDRKALLWKLDGLSDYDARRPLTATGTNLLGLVKHVATVEARYFGEVFGRPSPDPLPRWQGLQRQRSVGDRGRDPRSDHRVLPAHVGTLGRDDRRASPRRPRPRAVVAGASCRHEPVRRHGPCPRRVRPARRARRYPARGPRRPDRVARRTREADRRGSPCSLVREDRAGCQVGRSDLKFPRSELGTPSSYGLLAG